MLKVGVFLTEHVLLYKLYTKYIPDRIQLAVKVQLNQERKIVYTDFESNLPH